MRLHYLCLLLLLSFGFGGPVSAAATWVECHLCSDGQYVDAAVGATSTPGRVFVFDFGRGLLSKYQVEVERDASFGWVVKTAVPGTVGPRKQQQWEEAVALYEASLSAPAYPSPRGETAYDVINDDNAHRDLLDHYRILRGWMWHWDRIQMVLTALQGRLSNVEYVLVFQWPDGSFLRLEFVTYDTVTGTIQMKPVYAEDGDGNVIHLQENADGYVGDTGQTTNPGAMTSYWDELGIAWRTESGLIPAGRCSFRCTANECILHCSNE